MAPFGTVIRTVAATAVAMAMSGIAYAQTLGVGSGSDSIVAYNLGAVIAGVTSKSAQVDVSVRQYDGNQWLALTSSGDVSFALCNVQDLRSAIVGARQFEGAELPNLRAVARLIDIRVALFVRRDSGINGIGELRGKRVPVRFESQASESVALTALLAAGGLTTADVEGVEFQTTKDAMAAFVEGRTDAMMAFVFDLALVGVDRDLGAERGTRLDSRIKMLGVPEDSEAVAAMKAVFPDAYFIITNPIEGRPGFERLRNTRLPGVGGETRTMAYDVLLAASTETDDELVFKVVKALAANRNAFFVTGEPQFVSFGKGTMATQYDGIEYHPGAVRYYSEAGIWPGN